MSADRLSQLRALLTEEPGDLFLRYAIALELKRGGDNDQAIADLEGILRDEPKHITSYYQLATLLNDVGRRTEAIESCEAGALQCLVTGDRKARSELLALKEVLEDEE